MRPAALESAHKGLSDAEIARRVAAGDEDALRLLMRRYNQTLYRTARSILKDDAEAEDAVQEAYLRAYRAIGPGSVTGRVAYFMRPSSARACPNPGHWR